MKSKLHHLIMIIGVLYKYKKVFFFIFIFYGNLYSTVTTFAKLRGLSGLISLNNANL